MRLLVVEDEARMAAALARGLEAEGFVVDIAGDGPSGLEAARFGGYDAVLLDVMLPGASGYTVVKTLRAEQNWVPVLMLTAKDGEYDEADGLDYGADDYLTKPFSFVVLLARLRALLRREAGPRPTALTVGPISLDPAAHRVTLDGAEVSVSRREFLVLEHLLRAHPAVVSKESILDAVWGSPDETDANIVEVYVGYLRRKLGRARIETVRGVGYRMAP
ncbi:MAG TPA: response regulator transcription factor [Pedococcus sp.]|nr:response regulator transcription factor [Pedococcus sp.]